MTAALALAVTQVAWAAPPAPAATASDGASVPLTPPLSASSHLPRRLGDPGPDLTPYRRPLVAGEQKDATTRTSTVTMIDVVVAAGLGASDTVGDTETSIAIDRNDPNNITIGAFSGSWSGAGSDAPLWTSTDGGATWTKQFSMSAPPGQPNAANCPCDQTFDYGKSSSLLFGTTLGRSGSLSGPIWTGDTSDPTSAVAWQWLTSGGIAAPTDHSSQADQPWLLAVGDPQITGQDDVYVAYTDYSVNPPANRVAASLGSSPPSFPANQDVIVSTSPGTGILASAAVRVAIDPTSGRVWAAWETDVGSDHVTCAKGVRFCLASSTDQGQTWTPALNGGTTDTVSAQLSAEGRPPDPPDPCANHNDKFGTVNAMLGGSDAIAVDPGNGDLYYAFHFSAANTYTERLSVVRITENAQSGVTSSSLLPGQPAALPSVAVTESGAVGVLYDTYDGMASGFPQFSVHFATSSDHAVTWSDQTLVTFLSPTPDNGDTLQRVLGDYQQLKAVGNTFYAAFPANGAAFGRSLSNIDPVFYKAGAPGVPLQFMTLPPCRILDTRNATGSLGGPALTAGTRTFPTAGTCGIPATARALSVNVTVTGGTSGGDIRLFPASTTVPPTSVINFAPGRTLANNAVISVSHGKFTALLDSAGSVHLIIDVNGYYE
ncbi:MAG: hypothetical protein M3O15_01715 [Acidobacteriota bacterium]|nr:hypothetical protein [Acidobacteriota bacterium]